MYVVIIGFQIVNQINVFVLYGPVGQGHFHHLNHVELESVVPNKTYWPDSETTLVTRINLFLLIDFSLSLHRPQTYDDFVVVRCVL